jgi:hypothetical protein
MSAMLVVVRLSLCTYGDGQRQQFPLEEPTTTTGQEWVILSHVVASANGTLKA